MHQGVSGSFDSASAVVSQTTTEFSGTESAIVVSADLLTFQQTEVIRLTLSDPGDLDPTLAAGWEFAFFDIAAQGAIIGAHTDAD